MKKNGLSLKTRLLIFLSVVGPGIITANVDNDAGGITTYSQVGAQYGMNLLWSFIPITIILIMVQEMVNRMGVITGKGLSDLIRERFGLKITFYLMIGLLLTNMGNIMAEFSGVAASLELFGISKYISIPISAFIVWMLVSYGTYKSVERIFLIACIFYIAYPITAFIVKPDMNSVASGFMNPTITFDKNYIYMLMGLIGTTIAPWMQFYQQASVVEKNISVSNYKYSRMDTIFGGIIVNIVAVFIVIVCAETLFSNGIIIKTASDTAKSLAPLAGKYAGFLFAFGLFNASLFAASILPLSTAYTICESFGWESGLDKNYKEAKQFYSLYTLLILIGATITLIPDFPLIKVMIISQVINGVILPIVLIFMLILASSDSLMGEYKIKGTYKLFCWITLIIITIFDFFFLGIIFR